MGTTTETFIRPLKSHILDRHEVWYISLWSGGLKTQNYGGKNGQKFNPRDLPICSRLQSLMRSRIKERASTSVQHAPVAKQPALALATTQKYNHFGSFVFSDLLGNKISNSLFQSITCFGIQPSSHALNNCKDFGATFTLIQTRRK